MLLFYIYMYFTTCCIASRKNIRVFGIVWRVFFVYVFCLFSSCLHYLASFFHVIDFIEFYIMFAFFEVFPKLLFITGLHMLMCFVLVYSVFCVSRTRDINIGCLVNNNCQTNSAKLHGHVQKIHLWYTVHGMVSRWIIM